MAFKAPSEIPEVPEEEQKHTSGYTEEQEEQIKAAKALIDKRDLSVSPVTLEEFRDVIAPWYRINRTSEFILHPEKIKKVRVPKEPKEKVVRVPKPKKLTKKQVQEKLQELIMKQVTKQEFTSEEIVFWKEQTGEDYTITS